MFHPQRRPAGLLDPAIVKSILEGFMSWRGNEFEAPGLEDLRATLVRKATFVIISTPKIHLSPATRNLLH